MVDYRKEWFRNRILTFLDEKNEKLFDQMCSRNNNKIGKQLGEFLEDQITDPSDLNHKVFFIFKAYYDKVVHEEILVAEKVIKPPTPPPEPEPEPEIIDLPKKKKAKGKKKDNNGAGKKKQERQAKSGDSAVQDNGADIQDESPGEKETKDDENGYVNAEVVGTGLDSEHDQANDMKDEGNDENRVKTGTKSVTIVEDNEGKGGKKAKKGKKKGRKSPPTVIETVTQEEEPEEPEPEFVYAKKIVEKVVKTPQLHGHFGTIVNYKPVKRRYVYFIRKTADGIPCPDFYEEAFAEMPNYFLVGTVSHDLLYSLNLLLSKMFSPLIESQFQEPHIEEVVEHDQSLAEVLTERRGPPNQVAFNTPSDYRQMALNIQRELDKEEGHSESWLSVDGDEDTGDEINLEEMLRRRDPSTRTSEGSFTSPMAFQSDTTQISTSPDQEIIKQELLSSVNKLIEMILW